MKDKLLQKLLKSHRFNRLGKQEKAVELADYEHQKRTFHSRPLATGGHHEQQEAGSETL